MRDFRKGLRWWLALAAFAALAQGCVTGQVLDARNAAPLAATVEAYASCTGPGCTVQGVGWQVTTAYSDGTFLFDAYGAAQAMARLDLPPGDEAYEIRISAPGFTTRTLFHRPSLREYVDPNTGEEYLYTALPQPVYLCPLGAPDGDGDTLCNDAEARYQTLPGEPDTDGDALHDDLELFGNNDLDIAYYGASPRHKDVFVEVDYYEYWDAQAGVLKSYAPPQDAMDQTAQAFDAAPVENPDQVDGIKLHVVIDNPIDPFSSGLDPDLNLALILWEWTDLDNIKNLHQHQRRSAVFHYALYADQVNWSEVGISRFMPAHDLVIGIGYQPDYPANYHASIFMHELGHNLGLLHGGNEFTNYKPNYLSIMNYLYDFLIVDGQQVLDYSRLRIAAVNERQLVETQGLKPVTGTSTSEGQLARYSGLLVCKKLVWNPLFDVGWQCDPELDIVPLTGTAAGPLDFNRNGVMQTAQIKADLNGNGYPTVWGVGGETFIASQDDWSVLYFGGNDFLGGGLIGGGTDASTADIIVETFSDREPPDSGCPLPRER